MKHFKILMTLGACVFGVTAAVQADVPTDNTAQAIARAALLAQINGGASTNQPAAPVAPAAPVPAPKPVVTAPVAAAPLIIISTNLAPAVSAPAAVAVTPAPAAAPKATSHPSTVIITPAPGAPDNKQTRLNVLSARYKANQITPLDYFTQREALMNGN